MKVLILGRANVGKSSLFNRLIKRKKSLVINEPGITRDILKGSAKWWGHEFEISDSGGLLSGSKGDYLSSQILKKIKSALSHTEAIILVADAKAGLRAEDFEALKMVRKTGKPFLLFVNKADSPAKTALLTAPFFELHPDFVSGSCAKNYGIDEIVEWMIFQKKERPGGPYPAKPLSAGGLSPFKQAGPALNQRAKQPKRGSRLKQGQALPPKEPVLRLFAIGRANSGKSLLCNQILSEDRMIISSKAGTTLDTVTEFFSHQGKNYSISDNPGSRRGKREEREKISFAKSRTELERADIALLVLDAPLGAGRQEARLARLCLEKRKPVILIANKMDLLKNLSREEKKQKREEIKRIFHFYPDLPTVFMSAKTGYHKDKLFKAIEGLRRKISFRVSASALNDFFMKTIRKAPAPVYGASDVKFYYISQTNKKPPEFIAFANYPKGVTPAYHRFVVNKIKEKWDLKGAPVAFHVLPKR